MSRFYITLKNQKIPYSLWVAVCYLIDGTKPGRNCNKMLVDAGHAKVKDFEDNKFERESWCS
jgi:hypothetical protein